jgi:5-methylcytosine-specific restriction endonuclease McrA
MGNRVSKSEWKKLRQLVFSRDNYLCIYCGSDESLECDHYFPKSKGGDDNFSNLVTACKRCNRRKSDKMPEIFIKELKDENEMV